MRVACIVPTYNGGNELLSLYESLKIQNIEFQLIIVDSSSIDGTSEMAKSIADKFLLIDKREFNHGGTRQLAVNKFPNFDIYIFLTQDVILANEESIKRILEPFQDDGVVAAYGRQIPHENATIFASHARTFSYAPRSQIKSQSDIPSLGIKTAFLSNSFAAYRADALKKIGGFPRHTIFAEDMYVAAKLILSGGKVAYAADAVCRHSHNYSIIEEFRRYFDMGVFHARENWIGEEFGGAGGEGLKYILSELRYLGLDKYYLWPISLIRNAIKYIGYKVGKSEKYIPIFIKKRIGMHGEYWVDIKID